ncbi:hypothetical protein HYPSUDRAFT_71287 [Hypholoma sublateritium FD-334 SS-4]|uniref:Uncharacterized protein n=1 Tax=Hypholoma sublateritium (strain FD-334 SS-4) TaxID=945553 RepID=A0A0D2NJ86_HYPSF|nr:hypothetical protein HYPSUDRAFT_71287 [Hypholoma sublateritium FD-334 SS-4]
MPSDAPQQPVSPESPPQSSSTLFENSHGVSVDGSSFQTFSGLNINVNVETGRTSDLVSPGKPPPLPVQRSCDIYYRHLAVKGRGSPLWLPAPNWNLPKEYRRTGISIGDVGRITASGSFDFLFNILLPPDHPVHAGRVPEMFSPLYPPLDLDDVEMQEEFADDSYLASASVEKAQQDGQGSSGLTFETTDSEGAILTIPKGSDSSDLLNLTRFREYLAANVESWYRYTNGQRGREAKNGDLRLVIGWDKATAWGMATFSRSSKAATLFRLDFKPLEQTGRRYKWVYSGMAEGRTGPSTREVAELRRASEPEDVAFANQCLFIRTINHSLSDEVWERLKATKFGTIKSGDSAEYGSSSKAGKLEGKAKSTYAAQNPAGISSVALNQVADSSLTPSLLLHPSTSINEHLLRENPNARIAITEDINWISVLTEDDDSLPLNSHIVQRVLESHDIRTNGGKDSTIHILRIYERA